MSHSSKKHHFVPQAQLRHFAADAERRSIFVLDKRTDRSFRTSILNAGSENDFNTVGLGDSKWNFEDLFHDVDARSARLVAEILSRQSLAWLSTDDRLALADLFATQLLRTHFSRTTPAHLAVLLRETVRQCGYNPDHDPAMALPSDTAVRLGAIKMFLDRSQHVTALLRLHPALYRASGADRFMISDHPITLANAFPYGDRGLNSHGILAFLPISPEFAVALHCPTIVNRYERIEHADLEIDVKERMLRYRDGLRTGDPVDVDDSTILYLNHCQIAQSARYLYSSADKFDVVGDYLKKHPEGRSVTTHTTLGEIGRAAPRRKGMPGGIQLVVHGPIDHGMLAIQELDEAGEGITARTNQIELLAQMAADAGTLRTELYVAGQVRRMLGSAMIEPFGDPTLGWFRVVHRDPSLRELGRRLDRGRR